MKLPMELKPALLGALGGAALVALVGFTWGGWVSASSADLQVREKVGAAVVAALAPICADNFRKSADATARLVEIKKTNEWEQAGYVEKGGWAKMPGTAVVDSSLARACAVMIVSAKP